MQFNKNSTGLNLAFYKITLPTFFLALTFLFFGNLAIFKNKLLNKFTKF